MSKNLLIFAFLFVCIGSGMVFSQDDTPDLKGNSVGDGASFPPITMSQVLEEASHGDADLLYLDQSVVVAKMQHSLDLAKQGIALSANGAYSLTDGLSPDKTSAEQSLLSKAESASSTGSPGSASSVAGIGQAAQGSLALSTPLSKRTLSVSHSVPVPTAASNTSSSVLGLTGSQTIWDGYPGGQFKATLEKSDLTFRGKQIADVQSRSSALAKVKQSYISMLAAQRDLSIKRQVFEKQSKLLAQIQKVFDLRQASAIDLKTSQINARSAEIDVATADKTLKLANERLAVMIGRKSDERFTVAEIPDPQLPASTIDEAIKIGLSRRSDLAQYQISAKSAAIDATLANAQKSLVFSLTGGAGVAISWTNTPAFGQALSFGGKVSLPVFDSGLADLQVKISKEQTLMYNMQVEQLGKTLASDIRDFYETTQLLAEKMDLAKQSMDLAEEQFELVKTQNSFGTATMQDVLTSSVTAATAEVNYGTVRNSYILSELSLETAMGL